MLADSEGIHCCGLLTMAGVLTQSEDHEDGRSNMSGHNQQSSRTSERNRWRAGVSQGSTPGEALADDSGSCRRFSGRPCVRNADAFAVCVGWIVDFGPLKPAERFDAATGITSRAVEFRKLAQKEDDMGNPAKLTMRSSRNFQTKSRVLSEGSQHRRISNIASSWTMGLVARTFQCPAGDSQRHQLRPCQSHCLHRPALERSPALHARQG